MQNSVAEKMQANNCGSCSRVLNQMIQRLFYVQEGYLIFLDYDDSIWKYEPKSI